MLITVVKVILFRFYISRKQVVVEKFHNNFYKLYMFHRIHESLSLLFFQHLHFLHNCIRALFLKGSSLGLFSKGLLFGALFVGPLAGALPTGPTSAQVERNLIGLGSSTPLTAKKQHPHWLLFAIENVKTNNFKQKTFCLYRKCCTR